MKHNTLFYANAVVNKFHSLPAKTLCTSANFKEYLLDVFGRAMRMSYNQGVAKGRYEMALEIKRQHEYPDEYAYQTKRWVESEISRWEE